MRGESGPGCAAPPPRKVSVCRTPLKYDPGKPGVDATEGAAGCTQARRDILWVEVIEGLSRGTEAPRDGPTLSRSSAEAGTLGRSRCQSSGG